MFGEWFSQISPRRWQAGKVLFLKGALPSLFQLFFLQGAKNELYDDGSLVFSFWAVVISWQQKSFDITKSKKCLLQKKIDACVVTENVTRWQKKILRLNTDLILKAMKWIHADGPKGHLDSVTSFCFDQHDGPKCRIQTEHWMIPRRFFGSISRERRWIRDNSPGSWSHGETKGLRCDHYYWNNNLATSGWRTRILYS